MGRGLGRQEKMPLTKIAQAHQATVGKPPFSTLIGSIAAVAEIGYGHAKLEKIA